VTVRRGIALLCVAILVALAVVMAACGPNSGSTPANATAAPRPATGVAATPAPQASSTPLPSPSAVASPTVSPTATPTPSPTATRAPAHITAANADRLQPTSQLSYPGYSLASASFAPDTTSYVFGLSDGTVQLWQAGTPVPVVALKVPGAVGAKTPISALSVSLASDLKSMAAGTSSNKVELWSFSQLDKPVEGGHGAPVRAVSISGDSKLLASGSGDKNVQLRRIADGKQLGTMSGHTGSVESLAFSADGTLLASGSEDRSVILWQTSDRKQLRRLPGHQDTVWSVAFSPSSQILASGSDAVRLWQVNAPGLPQVLERPQNLKGPVKGLAFNPAGDVLAGYGTNSYIALWRVSDGQLLGGVSCQSCDPSLLTIHFSDDGLSLAAVTARNQVVWWTVP
jgi:WD40 repeat protein